GNTDRGGSPFLSEVAIEANALVVGGFSDVSTSALPTAGRMSRSASLGCPSKMHLPVWSKMMQCGMPLLFAPCTRVEPSVTVKFTPIDFALAVTWSALAFWQCGAMMIRPKSFSSAFHLTRWGILLMHGPQLMPQNSMTTTLLLRSLWLHLGPIMV